MLISWFAKFKLFVLLTMFICRRKCVDCLRVIASIFSEEIKSVLNSQFELDESGMTYMNKFSHSSIKIL